MGVVYTKRQDEHRRPQKAWDWEMQGQRYGMGLVAC